MKKVILHFLSIIRRLTGIVTEYFPLVLFIQHGEEFEAEHQTPDQESRLAKIEGLLQDLTQKTEVLKCIT